MISNSNLRQCLEQAAAQVDARLNEFANIMKEEQVRFNMFKNLFY